MRLRGIRLQIVRVVVMAIIVGIAWVILQFYTEEEIAELARNFWSWWSTLITGDFAIYWNPLGAGVVLGIILLIVLAPLAILFHNRRDDITSH